MASPPTTQLAAEQACAAAFCQFQRHAADHGTTASLLASAHEHGFSWFSRPATDALGVQVVLRHIGGAAFDAIGDDPAQLLLGLLGRGFGDLYPVTVGDPAPAAELTPLTQQQEAAPEPVAPAPSAKPAIRAKGGDEVFLTRAAAPAPITLAQPEPPAAQAAAESLAAATGGKVFQLADGDPALTPLTDAEKATAVQMIKELTAPQRKTFAIAFRNAFGVDKEEKSIIPLITELRHAQFVNRFSIEAAGGVAP